MNRFFESISEEHKTICRQAGLVSISSGGPSSIHTHSGGYFNDFLSFKDFFNDFRSIYVRPLANLYLAISHGLQTLTHLFFSITKLLMFSPQDALPGLVESAEHCSRMFIFLLLSALSAVDVAISFTSRMLSTLFVALVCPTLTLERAPRSFNDEDWGPDVEEYTGKHGWHFS